MKSKQNFFNFILIILIVWVLAFFDVPVMSSLGLISVAYIGNKFLNELGHSITIFELFLFIAGFQWIIGPFMLYRIEPDLMYVSENEYMFITVTAYLCFVFGCLFFQKKKAILEKNKIAIIMARPNEISFTKKIFWIGLLFFFISLIAKTAFDFIFTILCSFSFIAAIMLLYSPIKNKSFYVILIYLLLFFKCIYQVVFADFIAQCFLLIIFLPNIYVLSKKKIVGLMAVGILTLSVLNAAKTAYREKMWTDSGAHSVDVSYFFTVLFNSNTTNEENNDSFIYRISSGSVNSDIFSYVPSRIKHTHGEVLLEDFANAIIPRFLYSDKKDVDTRKNYMLYTGKYLGEDTSVGVNALGIGYAEFGVFGCFVFMLLYGMFLCGCLNYFVNMSQNNILYLFTIIVVFIGLSKAETEFVGNINGLLKVMLFVLLAINLIHKINPRLFRYAK